MVMVRLISQRGLFFSSLIRIGHCQKLFFWRLTLLAIVLFSMDPLLAQNFANDRSEIVRMINDAGRALSARNAPRFLSYFDKKNIPNYFQLEDHIDALTAQTYIASSVRFMDWHNSNNGYQGTIDWMVRLTLIGVTGRVQTRRTVVRVSVARSVKSTPKWKITNLDPIDFFRPW